MKATRDWSSYWSKLSGVMSLATLLGSITVILSAVIAYQMNNAAELYRDVDLDKGTSILYNSLVPLLSVITLSLSLIFRALPRTLFVTLTIFFLGWIVILTLWGLCDTGIPMRQGGVVQNIHMHRPLFCDPWPDLKSYQSFEDPTLSSWQTARLVFGCIMGGLYLVMAVWAGLGWWNEGRGGYRMQMGEEEMDFIDSTRDRQRAQSDWSSDVYFDHGDDAGHYPSSKPDTKKGDKGSVGN
ncbi:hypothetical protein B0J14DRAFT_576674 [Halenospora varia]|nr:hypothetical protein B0J14DRAFT_576674 [Halenospora varia]